MSVMLNKAEGIFYQIKEAEHLTDNIRFILGLPILGSQNAGKINKCKHNGHIESHARPTALFNMSIWPLLELTTVKTVDRFVKRCRSVGLSRDFTLEFLQVATNSARSIHLT